MPAPYADMASLKARFAIPDSFDDTLITAALDGTSRAIDQHCKRVFYTTAATATFIADDRYCLSPAHTDVWAGDIVSITTLSTDDDSDGAFETVWAASDFQLWPVNAAFGPEKRPYRKILAVAGKTFPVQYVLGRRPDRVQIVGTFGWPVAVPVSVREACLIAAGEMFKLKDAPFGVAGFDPFGAAVRILRENPVAAKLLRPYQRVVTG